MPTTRILPQRPFCLSALFAVLLATACETVVVERDRVDAKVLAQHEARLMRPFEEAGTLVACKSLSIEVNPVFAKLVSYPAGKRRVLRGEGWEEMRWSTADRIKIRQPEKTAAPLAETKIDRFRIVIGKTEFRVDDSVRIRLLHRAPPTLTARAAGLVMVIKNGKKVVVTKNGKKADTFTEVEFAEGQVRTR